MPMATCNVIDRSLHSRILQCYIVLCFHILQDFPGDPLRNRSSMFLCLSYKATTRAWLGLQNSSLPLLHLRHYKTDYLPKAINA